MFEFLITERALEREHGLVRRPPLLAGDLPMGPYQEETHVGEVEKMLKKPT